MIKPIPSQLALTAVAFLLSVSTTAASEVLIADFESETYGEWQTTGTAFGDGPARGSLPGQMSVTGYQGDRLVNSFVGGDGATGTLTSPEFVITQPWINLRVGGGGYAGETEVQLLIDGEIVCTATGTNVRPGGTEWLEEASWDVASLVGKSARIKIVDQRTGSWGHINVDDLRQSDSASTAPRIDLQKELLVDDEYLIVPVSNKDFNHEAVLLQLSVGDDVFQTFNVTLPGKDEPHWLAAYPLAPFGVTGKSITIAPADPEASTTAIASAFNSIRIGKQSEATSADDFDQPYRNQFHIATRRGWNNDPNGMVYHDGVYHLYYQLNPFGIFWGNMHWGHFTSTDLVNWTERPIVMFQNTVRDMMFSGGGFVDHNNTAGYGEGTLFIAFTSTGRGECLAYSTDGGNSFTELPENPVIKHNGRDPKITWYAPEKKWVMVVYNEDETELTKSTPIWEEMENRAHAKIDFYESTNLHHWAKTGSFTDPDRVAVYECPEFFYLPLEGKFGEQNSSEGRWVLTGAPNRYFLGTFDGKVFTKQSGPHGDPRVRSTHRKPSATRPTADAFKSAGCEPTFTTNKFPNKCPANAFRCRTN